MCGWVGVGDVFVCKVMWEGGGGGGVGGCG